MKATFPKLGLPLAAIAMWSGCASAGPPLVPSLRLPTPVSDLRAVRKGDRVYLSWTDPRETSDHENIRSAGPTLVCRSQAAPIRECGAPVAKIAPPAKIGAKASYTDTLLPVPGVAPDAQITYAVEALNDRGRGAGLSNQVRVPLFPAMPPPADFEAKVTAEGVRFSWECPSSLPAVPGVGYRLRVYRRAEASSLDEVAAEVNFADCNGAAVLDTGFEWEKTYDYRAAVISVISEPGEAKVEIEGDDTPSLRVFAHDIFPPAVPNGLQAVFSGVGQPPFVDLIWTPDSDADLAGYNVYRREEGGVFARLNPELVKTSAFRDPAVQTGKKYFYAVSAVDVRGNESAKSAEASEEAP